MRETQEVPMGDVFDRDEVADVLRSTFYGKKPSDERVAEAPGPRPRVSAPRAPKKARPEHYEVICISLYREDLEALDAKVAELKERGHRKMSRSSLIRYALDHVDLTKLPRSY